MEYSKEKIIEFIALFADGRCMFMKGLCYYFACALQMRFGGGMVVYDQSRGHFMWEYCGKVYDAEGVHEIPANAKSMIEIKRLDPILYKRVMRDCVLKV